MQRRKFITLLGGAAVAWPLAAYAQPGEGVRRLAVLMALPETDPEARALLSEFTQSLAGLGWADGRNMRMDVRWAASNVDLMRKFAKELVDLQPDAILANSTPATAALQHSSNMPNPVMFRPGRDRLAIKPEPTGSPTIANTIGIVCRWAAFMFNPDTA